MTPMGPGTDASPFLQEASRATLPKWPSTLGTVALPWPFLPTVVYAQSEGWSATAKAGGFQARLTQKGQQHVGYQGAYLSGYWNQRGERWQSRLQIRRLYAMASGRSQWESSRLGVSVQGNFSRISRRALPSRNEPPTDRQASARELESLWVVPRRARPSAWLWRTEGQVQGKLTLTLQRGSMPWLDQVAVRYAHPRGFSVSAQLHRSGGSVRFSAKTFSLTCSRVSFTCIGASRWPSESPRPPSVPWTFPSRPLLENYHLGNRRPSCFSMLCG